MEKHNTGLNDCLRILQSCIRKRMSAWSGASQRLLRPASRFLRSVRFSSKGAAVLTKSCWMPTEAEYLNRDCN